MPRDSHTRSLLGPDVYKKVQETPILVVGAGGIGCELCELPVSVPSFLSSMTHDISKISGCFILDKELISIQ